MLYDGLWYVPGTIFIFIVLQDCYLAYILTEMSGCTSVVFTRNSKATHFLTIMLRHLGLRAIPISGQMSQVIYINLTKVKNNFYL